MTRRTLHLEADDEVGLWLAAIDDARRRTLEVVGGIASDGSPLDVGEDVVDRGRPNTIGSVLYHLAAIEADWLLDDICGTPEEMTRELFPYDVREEGGMLTPVTSMRLDEHLAHLEKVRGMFHERLGSIGGQEFHRVNERANYDVSPIWVVHHLLQHEAEHRAEIGAALRDA